MIPVASPDLGPKERRYLLEAFDSGWISSKGPFLERAEGLLQELASVRCAAVVSNGTVALHLALLACGIGPGDEVVIPALTYVATMNAVLYVGATPVLVDVDRQSWCLDPTLVESAVTERTRAVLAVDLYGMPADYERLRAVTDRHGLFLIADAAESIGATDAGVPTASFADVAVFSFFGNKIVTSGEGGAVVTSSTAIDERVRLLRNQGNDPDVRYAHLLMGFNYRMTNLSAAILCGQLERLPEILAGRRDVFRAYRERLAVSRSVYFQEQRPGVMPAPWLVTAGVAGQSRSLRDSVIASLLEGGIESRPTFRLLSEMPFAPERTRGNYPIAQVVSDEGISLPTFNALELDEIGSVVDQFLSRLSRSR